MRSPVRDTGSTPVIRDQLRAALDAALDAAGFAQPAGGVTLELPQAARAR